ncbi:protein Mo11 [Beluga whale alphaherpesvirus 1]|uniref:Protein Mo11 n=1 Tax=Beluga whale alphaherpesvirus 1 TaxID=1434720 RepID=A0A286MMA2_9ALPH|nr:protein Mo11 [Beluga whale alphaherpesvirus 1]ASW27128.1 protein Mo11 [Beluga whale alphaherpesvirus 1]
MADAPPGVWSWWTARRCKGDEAAPEKRWSSVLSARDSIVSTATLDKNFLRVIDPDWDNAGAWPYWGGAGTASAPVDGGDPCVIYVISTAGDPKASPGERRPCPRRAWELCRRCASWIALSCALALTVYLMSPLRG